ncbi:hypothetical protein DSO57_1008681 [Entomophthora muscae]|uniref:Uncharacterized protein n=1 Tax=Entomophthora muscae TaxID=34485 RepID=A0ACC2T715_9FUNG|nr:hypothetical protein DSO57_1008681 [Entomophthora muscae]
MDKTLHYFGFPCFVSLHYHLVFLLGWLYDKVFDHIPTIYTNQTVALNTLAHSSPPPTYAQAHFTAYGSEFSTNSQKVFYLAEKLTGHYRDWFSSHLIHNPGILQNYDLFVSSLLSFSGEDKELSIPSASRLQASDTEAYSFYKIGLNRLLQEFLVHHNLPKELEPLIREVPGCLSQTRPRSLKPLHLAPSQSLGEVFALLLRKSLEEDHLLPACLLSKCPPFANKTSTLALLSLNDTSKSPTVLVTIHGPLGKIKVLALLDTGADANFIEEKLTKLLGLPAFGSLDVKVGNSTLIGATPILQPVTIDLEGSPFHVTCNSSPNLSFQFILGFPWLRESLLNFDHPNNKISFT